MSTVQAVAAALTGAIAQATMPATAITVAACLSLLATALLAPRLRSDH